MHPLKKNTPKLRLVQAFLLLSAFLFCKPVALAQILKTNDLVNCESQGVSIDAPIPLDRLVGTYCEIAKASLAKTSDANSYWVTRVTFHLDSGNTDSSERGITHSVFTIYPADFHNMSIEVGASVIATPSGGTRLANGALPHQYEIEDFRTSYFTFVNQKTLDNDSSYASWRKFLAQSKTLVGIMNQLNDVHVSLYGATEKPMRINHADFPKLVDQRLLLIEQAKTALKNFYTIK